MKIFLFGIAQVGKTTVGSVLAKRLDYRFFDHDAIITKQYGSVEEFQAIYSNRKERYEEKTDIVYNYYKRYDDFVFAVSPIYSAECNSFLSDNMTDALLINLTASNDAIYDRVGFYDENMNLLPDSDEYKKAHKAAIYKEIENDQKANMREFSYFKALDTTSKTPDEVASEIIDMLK